MVRVLVDVIGCVPQPTEHSLVTLFSLSVSVKDHPLLWMVVRSQTYYPKHIVLMGAGRLVALLSWVPATLVRELPCNTVQLVYDLAP